jgi:methyl-accepting chemotaxis protein
MSEAAAATEQQSEGVSQIAIAIEQINLVTQTVAANSEESSAASVELRDRAEHLTTAVAAFTIDAPAARRPAAAPVARPAAQPAVKVAPRKQTVAQTPNRALAKR